MIYFTDCFLTPNQRYYLMNIKRFFSFLIVLNLLFCSIFTQANEKPFIYQEQLYHPSGNGNTQQIQSRFLGGLGGIGGIIGGAAVTYTVYLGFQHLSSKWEYLPPIGLTNDDITKIEATYSKLIRLTSAERTELGIVDWTQLSDDFGSCLMMSIGQSTTGGACRRVAIYSDVDPAKIENEYERGAHNVRRGLHIMEAGVYFFSEQVADPYNFIPGGVIVRLSDKFGGAVIGIVKKDNKGVSHYIDRRNTETNFGKSKQNPCAGIQPLSASDNPANIVCQNIVLKGDKTTKGRIFTDHGAQQANARNFTSENIDAIIDNNKKNRVAEYVDGDKVWRYQDSRGNTVIMSEFDERIITTYSHPASKANGMYIPNPNK